MGLLCLAAVASGCEPASEPAQLLEIHEDPPPEPPPPAEFHCGLDEGCPAITIAGDPIAEFEPGAGAFRGYGDPSIEYDPDTGALWLAYSWLDVAVSQPDPPVVLDLAVRTHLARSDDGGASFGFVRAANEVQLELHPDSAEAGWRNHEVPTLVREGEDGWQLLWLKYWNAFGPLPEDEDEREEVLYQRSLASSAGALGDTSEVWVRGPTASPSWGATLALHDLSELADCAAFTEPALFARDGEVLLATTCIVLIDEERRPERERLVLLREILDGSPGYEYVGTLLDAQDAADFGADALEQADLAVARDGRLVLFVTPIVFGADPEHQGCLVFDVARLDTAELVRDQAGRLVPRAILTADGNGLGPGMCTYDAESETGVLMVITTFAGDPLEIDFSLHATGFHP